MDIVEFVEEHFFVVLIVVVVLFMAAVSDGSCELSLQGNGTENFLGSWACQEKKGCNLLAQTGFSARRRDATELNINRLSPNDLQPSDTVTVSGHNGTLLLPCKFVFKNGVELTGGIYRLQGREAFIFWDHHIGGNAVLFVRLSGTNGLVIELAREMANQNKRNDGEWQFSRR